MFLNNQIEILKQSEKSRIIEMAWEDRTPFEAIETLYGLTEPQVIKLMRQSLKHKTFKTGEQEFQGERVSI